MSTFRYYSWRKIPLGNNFSFKRIKYINLVGKRRIYGTDDDISIIVHNYKT